ncbi:hydroxyacid dehydrogenase [Candidatus Micrarchaeota archaeon]|nr:hydroxyacid dehydrogenase [Candidatus Micrarchaeota archaeon]
MLIVISDNMEQRVLDEIRELGTVEYKPENLENSIRNADVLIVRSATKVTAGLLSKAEKLRLVIRAGVGTDNIDLAAAKERKVAVKNTPEASTNAVAELALGVIITGLRNVQKAHHQMKNGEWKKKELVGNEIAGKTLGVIGYGRIGRSLAEKAKALGMRIIAYNSPAPDGKEFVDLDALFAQSDVISLHVPLTAQTKNMINREAIAKMKEGVFIVNTSRGEVIDEEALYEGCKTKLKGAALDVYKSEPYTGKLLELDNVYCTPHIAASTKEAQERIGRSIVDILKEFK